MRINSDYNDSTHIYDEIPIQGCGDPNTLANTNTLADTNIWPIPIPLMPKMTDTLADSDTDTSLLFILFSKILDIYDYYAMHMCIIV